MEQDLLRSRRREHDRVGARGDFHVEDIPGAQPRGGALRDAHRADPLLAQSAVDRLLNSAYELVLDGPTYRSHQKPVSPGRGQS